MGSLLGRRSSRIVSVASVVCFATALLMQSGAAQQAAAEVVIHNCLIIHATGKMAGDIRIRGEKIVEIAPHITASSGAKEIDAKGMLLLPGAIDTHTHLSLEPVV